MVEVKTMETAERMEKLEALGASQFTAEKLVSKITSDEDWDNLIDCVGRINAYVNNFEDDKISRLKYLLHSNRSQYNFGALKELGFENPPAGLIDTCVYLSFIIPKEYEQTPIKQEETVVSSEEKEKPMATSLASGDTSKEETEEKLLPKDKITETLLSLTRKEKKALLLLLLDEIL